MFPLYVKFKKDIKLVNPEKQSFKEIIAFFEKRLSARRADNIMVSDDSLTFRNNLFRLFMCSWAIMLPVDSGKIQLYSNNVNKLKFEYVVSFRRIFLIAGAVSLLIYDRSESIYTGLISFAWLGGMNWIIGVIRHRLLFRNMISEIQYWE